MLEIMILSSLVTLTFIISSYLQSSFSQFETDSPQDTYNILRISSDGSRREVKQMQPMQLCIFSGRQFKDPFENTHKHKCNQCDYASSGAHY